MREQASRFRPGPTLRAAAVFAAFLVVFLVVDRLSGPGGEQDDGEAVSTTETTTPTETTAGPPAEPPETETTEAPETTQPPAEEPAPEQPAPEQPEEAPEEEAPEPAPAEPGTGKPDAPLRSADGVTLQILNGTGELRLARDFKPLARAEGYDIVNSGNANGDFPVSTIFFTPGHREDAEAFKARFPAFEVVAPSPDNLSDTVALHAVLGENYEP